MTAIWGTDYQEIPCHERIGLMSGDCRAQRKFLVKQSKLTDFAHEFYGTYSFVGDIFVGIKPQRHPLFNHLFVYNIDFAPVQGLKATGTVTDPHRQMLNYDGFTSNGLGWEATVQYRDLHVDRAGGNGWPEVDDYTFLTADHEVSADYLSTGSGNWYWGTSNPAPQLDPTVTPGIRQPNIDLRVTWERIAYPPFSAIFDQVGTINDATFLNGAAGTVLFNGVSSSTSVQVSDIRRRGFLLLWNLTYSFTYKRTGWNYFWRQSTGNYVIVQSSALGSGNPPYEESDFGDLFAQEFPS